MPDSQLADLGVQRLHIDGGRGRFRSRLRTEHPGSPLQELSLPRRNLVGMDIELLRQFGQRLLTPHGGQGHLCLECRRMVPAGSSAHRLSCSAAILAAVRQKLHSSRLCRFPEPPLTVEITVSIGVAARRAEDGGAEALLKRADLALYKAKGDGRDRVVAAAA